MMYHVDLEGMQSRMNELTSPTLPMPMFTQDALRILNSLAHNPTCEPVYEMLSDSLRWPDEMPRFNPELATVMEGGTYRALWNYRSSLIQGVERIEFRPIWQQVVEGAPNWPGLRPDRRRAAWRDRLQAERIEADRARNAWLLRLPAGIGWATLRSIARLWLSVSPDRSGVFSAGNGPAMRAAILGAAIDDTSLLRSLVRVSTHITHRDPKAEHGALAVAFAARFARQGDPIHGNDYLTRLRVALDDGDPADELLTHLDRAVASVQAGDDTESFAESMGLARGVSGYVLHTVPVAIHAWLRHPQDFRSAVTAVVRCGGDTDTTAAIVGGIIGSRVGKSGIPADWLSGLMEWPCTAAWLEMLGSCLAESLLERSGREIWYSLNRGRPGVGFGIRQFGRNSVFLLIVLFHVFRRWLPPY